MWHVYIVNCIDNTLYTGITNDLDKRIATHNKGKGARYTETRRPVTLLISFEVPNKSAALKAEYKIKQLYRADKLKVKGYDVEKNELIF